MIPIWAFKLGLVAAVFAAGWGSHAYKTHRDELAENLARSETNRESERLASSHMMRVSDALNKDRLATDRRAAGLEQRLRDLANRLPPAAGCPSGNDDPRPAAAVLSDETRRDLVEAAKEADAVADRLRAWQASRQSH